MIDLLIKATMFAVRKHDGQLDDTGKPYINHPEQVSRLLRMIAPNDINLQCAGYLHDTIEDTDTTYEELVAEFNKDIADLVNEVTHDGQKDGYGFYFPRLFSKRGILLKFADRLSNLSRMETWDDQRQKQYLKRSRFWKDGSDKPPL